MPTVVELGQKVKAKYPEYADMPDDEVGRRVKAKYPTEYADFTDEPAGPSLAERAVNLLPAAGGMAGGIIGGVGGTIGGFGVGGLPGAAGGAALGAAGGEAVKQLARRQMGLPSPKTPQEALGEIIQEGAVSNALQVGGGLLGKGVGMVGRDLVKRSLRPAAGLMKNFKDIVETAIERQIPVGGRAGVTGSQMANQARAAAAAETRKLIQQANAARVRVSLAEIARPAIKMEEEALGRALSPLEQTAVINAVRGRMAQMLQSRQVTAVPGIASRLKPTQAKHLKRLAQAMSRSALRAEGVGVMVSGNPAMDRAIAVGLRQGLNNAVPGLASSEARTQSLIGFQRAMADAEARSLPAQIPLFGPLRPFGAATPSLAVPPEAASTLGLALQNPALLQSLMLGPMLGQLAYRGATDTGGQ